MHHTIVALAALAGTALGAPAATSTAVPTKPYSVWMASSFPSKNQKFDYTYVPAVTFEGIQKAATVNNDSALLKYASDRISSLVNANGTVTGWRPTYYSLDDLRMANNVLYFWDSEGRKANKYKIAAQKYRAQLDVFPRNPAGGFWHRSPTYPNQMWLDGIYMAQQFYATYTSYFEPKNNTAWADIALQFDLIEEHCRNHSSNLLYHGYSADKSLPVWANNVTGASPHVWNRAVGWYFMALVEVLQVYPKSLPAYARLQTYLTTLADGLKKSQDTTGGWWLVMDEPYPGMKGNYIESSGTAMFAYGYLKGIRTGLLDGGYQSTALKAWDLMVNKFVQHETNGTLSWTGTVQVGSLSSNGSYEYYISVPLSLNDGKGAGPFMYAASEVEQLSNYTRQS